MTDRIFDSHAHYTDSAFDADRKELIKNLLDNNVGAIMLAATDTADSEACKELALEFDNVYSSVGIHPEYAAQNRNLYPTKCTQMFTIPLFIISKESKEPNVHHQWDG